MRLRNVKNASVKLEASPYFLSNPKEMKGKWSKDKPLHLEIGTGKGDFLIGMAKQYPSVFFVGVEKYESVLVRAIEKTADLELNNLKFMCYDASSIDKVFDHEVDTLYLNFSDPWPKTRHHKRRLTSPLFLDIYDKIFKTNPHLIQKTDNISLFAYSLECLSKHGYTLEKVSLDLANEKMFNVRTEYEEKFMNLGYKINYVDAIKKEDK